MVTLKKQMTELFFFLPFFFKNKFITDTLNQTIKDDWDH